MSPTPVAGGVFVAPPLILPGAAGTLPNAAASPGWHQAIGRVASGVGDATLLCVGDSILSGLFTNSIGPGPTSEMERVLAAILGITVTDGLAVPVAGAGSGPDNRFAAGAGWSLGSAAFPGNSWGGVVGAGGQTIWFGANAAAGSLVFTPRAGLPRFTDTYDIYSIGGSFSCNFALGTNTVLGSSSGLQKTTVSGAAAQQPVGVCTAPTGIGCFIIGFDGRLSTAQQLRVGNASTTSASTGGNASQPGWTNTSGASGSQPQQCIAFYNPNACLLQGSVNDLAQGITLAQSLANFAVMSNTAKACQGGAGGVIWASENPCNPTAEPGGTPAQAAYWAALKGFCLQNGYPFIDIFSNLNGATNGFAILSAMNPSYYGDGNSIHPGTNPGMPDYGRMLGQGLALL